MDVQSLLDKIPAIQPLTWEALATLMVLGAGSVVTMQAIKWLAKLKVRLPHKPTRQSVIWLINGAISFVLTAATALMNYGPALSQTEYATLWLAVLPVAATIYRISKSVLFITVFQWMRDAAAGRELRKATAGVPTASSGPDVPEPGPVPRQPLRL